MAKSFLYRLTYQRRGAISWLAHLDMMHLFERAFRRASFPLAYTQGYNQRPELVFALPIGLGIEADREILEIKTSKVLAEASLELLNNSFPQGLKVLSIELIEPRKTSLMALVKEAVYYIKTPGIARASQELLESEGEIWVQKKSKRKYLDLDIRPLILQVEEISEDEIRLRLSAGSVANLRVDLFLKALEERNLLARELSLGSLIRREELVLF